jgi:hypothetical protein
LLRIPVWPQTHALSASDSQVLELQSLVTMPGLKYFWHLILKIFLIFFVMLGIKLRTLQRLCKCSTCELYPQQMYFKWQKLHICYRLKKYLISNCNLSPQYFLLSVKTLKYLFVIVPLSLGWDILLAPQHLFLLPSAS